jgi:hypothetical protein
MDHQPETRTPMLAYLTDYIDLAGTADGLEFLFLTLINAANIDQDRDAFGLAVSVWKANAIVAEVNGAGPIGFYDMTNRKMAIYADSSAQSSIRSGVDLFYGSDIASAILSLGFEVLDEPYGFGDNASSRAKKFTKHAKGLLRPDTVYGEEFVEVADASVFSET